MRAKLPIVLTSIQILRMVTRTRADASIRMSADQISRCGVIFRVCQTVWRSSQGTELQTSLSVGTMCSLAEIELHLAGNVITCELLMMKFQRLSQDEVFSGCKSLCSKKIKDAMNVAVISTLARGRNWDNSGRS